MSWKVAHACVRGSSHRRSGLPNQDAVQAIVAPAAQGTVAVAVVSDGHGSPRHFRSQVGSSLAVSTVAATLQTFLADSVALNGKVPFVPEQVHELERRIVSGWLSAVHSDLDHNPFSESELATVEAEEGVDGRAAVENSPELAYGATLLAAAATDHLLLYLQLGDGEILSVDTQGVTTRPLPPDDRLVANQTTSLCQPEAWKEFRSSWVTDGALPSLVLLSTDGYANSFRSDEDFLKIGQDYLEIIRQQGISSLAEELPDILNEATQQGSGDDITLAILQDDLSATGAKVPRPLMTPASKSALIEQLKARHSSQQHKLQELAVSIEETRKDNQRLRNTILFLVFAALAVLAFIFRDRILPHPPAAPPLAPVLGTPSKKPAAAAPPTAPTTATPTAPVAAHPTPAVHKSPPAPEWLLVVNGKDFPLKKGSTLPRSFHPEAVGTLEKDYARVAWDDKKGMVLINDSKDNWAVSKGKKVANADELPLGGEPITIKFSHDLSGTVRPTGDAPATGHP
jgi:serine/threonine protein phosphatase PrpC